jgi:hypothetical protein
MECAMPKAGFFPTSKCVILAAALTLFCAVSSASADIIDVTYTGTANGIRPTIDANGRYDVGSFINKPFIAEFHHEISLR